MSDNKFYTFCSTSNNEIVLSGYDNGKRYREKVNYKPSLFVDHNIKSQYKTHLGNYVTRQKFDSISKAKDFCNENKHINIYGNRNYNYAYIYDNFPHTIDPDFSLIKVAYYDIETTCDISFPDINDPQEVINAITLECNGKIYVFGLGNFETTRKDIHYFKCTNESELLSKFISTMVSVDPDIISGWNCHYFDNPYLVARATRVLGDNEIRKLSPWGKIITYKNFMMGSTVEGKDFFGRATLDYLELYKKFSYTPQPNYKLETVSQDELGEGKIDYSSIGNFLQLAKNDHQKFIEYNIQDVELIKKLENKKRFIEMVVQTAYDAKVNYMDVFKQVRLWENIIFVDFCKKMMVVPPKDISKEEVTIQGGYVKPPQLGLHNWIVSFDLNSLYPHLISQYNISPECLINEPPAKITVDNVIDMKYNTEYLKDSNVCLAGNGHHFKTSFQGFLPEILMNMYEDRKIFKNKMLENKQVLKDIKEELKKRGIE